MMAARQTRLTYLGRHYNCAERSTGVMTIPLMEAVARLATKLITHDSESMLTSGY